MSSDTELLRRMVLGDLPAADRDDAGFQGALVAVCAWIAAVDHDAATTEHDRAQSILGADATDRLADYQRTVTGLVADFAGAEPAVRERILAGARTSGQREAIVRAAQAMMVADGRLGEEEEALLSRVIALLGLSE